MKKLVLSFLGIFFALLIMAQKGPGYVMTITGPSQAPQTMFTYQVIASLHDDLVKYHPSEVDTADLFPRLKRIQSWVNSVTKTITPQDRLSVVGQTHMGGPLKDKSYESELLRSQTIIKDHILFGQYKAIIVEGMTEDSVGCRADNARNITDTALLNRAQLYPDEYPENPTDLLCFDVSLWMQYYTNLIPRSYVISGEDRSIWEIHGKLLYESDMENNIVLQKIQEHFIALRSIIAFYKAVEAIHKGKDGSGLIIIGSAHLPDFYNIALGNPLVLTIYDSSRIPKVTFNRF